MLRGTSSEGGSASVWAEDEESLTAATATRPSSSISPSPPPLAPSSHSSTASISYPAIIETDEKRADSETGDPQLTIDMLLISPDDLARQLTLLDIAIFKRIRSDELKGGVWMKKDKFRDAPNVVEFTRRFNHVSFWVIREILHATDTNQRALKIAHFIKLAKKLQDLNNLHSLLAVLSGLQSAPVYRLKRTWKKLNSKYVERFERLEEFMSEAENHRTVREHLSTTKLPCIPYLGMFLTDLTYLELATTQANGAAREHEAQKIFGDLERFQTSVYPFTVVGFIRDYLLSVNYAEELVRMVEDENYKLSLQLEPRGCATPEHEETTTSSSSIFGTPKMASLLSLAPHMSLPFRMRRDSKRTASPARAPDAAAAAPSVPPMSTFEELKKRGHRKTKSLGNYQAASKPYFGSRENLLLGLGSDAKEGLLASQPSTVDEPLASTGRASSSSPAATSLSYPSMTSHASVTSQASGGAKKPSVGHEGSCLSESDVESDSEAADVFPAAAPSRGASVSPSSTDGVLWKRKCGRMHLTKIFWASLVGTHLLLFSPIKDKSKGNKTDRHEFKPLPAEEYELQDAVIAREDGAHPERIHITMRSGDVLKLRTSGPQSRAAWVAALGRVQGVTVDSSPPPPTPGLGRLRRGSGVEASKISLLHHPPLHFDA